MTTDSSAIDLTGAQEVYKMLDQLDPHISSQDASGRALLYQAKERIRKLIIDMDRRNGQ